jgi:REP element-mobilizing transposase RayT
MEKFQNKYRIQSHRRPNWDYGANGVYFITLVTQNRECNLGNILHPHPSISLSDYGTIVQNEWIKSFNIRKELILDEYIIMPNHLHAIIILDNPAKYTDPVETHGRASLQPQPIPDPKTELIRNPKSISSFIAGFKSAVNSKIDDFIDENQLGIPKYNRNNHFFQPNYHDHIIRNGSEYDRIKNYIMSNPLKWIEDRFNPTNSFI